MGALRKILVALVVVSALTASAGAGTFASFSASTTNDADFQTGTIVLQTQRRGGSVIGGTATGTSAHGTLCLSTGGGSTDDNDNESCQIVMSSNTTLKPGDELVGNVTVENVGTLGATTLKVFAAPACTSVDDAGSYHGDEDLCGSLRISILETSADFTTAIECRYDDDNSGATCDQDTAPSIASFDDHTSLSPFTIGGGGLASLAKRHFQIKVKYADSGVGADNDTMGLIASLGIGWVIQQ